MGLFDIGAKILNTVKYDITDAEAKLKTLSGEEKKAAQERIAGFKASNAAIDDWAKSAATAAAGVAAAYAIGKAGFDEYTKTLQLQAGASRVNMEKLSDAAGGLKTKMELLTIAQAGSRGAWKLNSDQIAEVIRDMRGLTKEGFDQTQVQERLTEVIKKGSVEGLKDFGIVLKQTNNATIDSRNALDALRKQVTGLGGDYSMAGDDVRRAGVKWEDTLHGVKMAIGELVIAMGPLLNALAGSVGLIGKVASLVPHIPGAGFALGNLWRLNPVGMQYTAYEGGKYLYDRATERTADVTMYDLMKYGQTKNTIEGTQQLSGYMFGTAIGAQAQAIAMRLQKQADARKNRRGGSGEGGKFYGDLVTGPAALDLSGLDLGTEAFGFTPATPGNDRSDLNRANREFGQAMARYREEKRKSLIASVIGTPEEINATTQALGALASVTSTFVDAGKAAMDAWITGGDTASKAFKKAIAEGLRGLSGELQGQAIRHGLWALGDLAFGNFVGAGKHALAAGAFEAGSFAVGAIAREMGASTGQWVKPGKGASGGGYQLGGGGGGGATTTTTFNFALGDSLDYESPRSRAIRISRYQQVAARVAPPSSEGVRYS